MKCKLLAIDMDGTFLDNEHKAIDKNFIAVKKVAELGIKVVICSGRIPAALKLFHDDMPNNQPFIAANGGVIYDENHNEIYSASMDLDTITEVIEILRKDFPEANFQVMDEYVVYADSIGEMIKDFMFDFNMTLPRKHRMEFRLVPDILLYIKENNIKPLKIEIHDDNSILLSSIKERLIQLRNIEIVGSILSSLEITKVGVDKGKALAILANHYGYSLEECIAIGNDENDINMIREVGLGIAVNNANDNAKKVADYITERTNDEAALEEVVEKFIMA